MLNLKRRLLSGSAWALSFKLTTAILGLAVYAILARLLTQEDFGTYLLILSIVTFISIAVQMGMSKSAVRLVAESLAANDHERASHSVRITVRFIIAASIAVALFWVLFLNDLIASTLIHSPEMGMLGWITAGWFILLAFQKHFAEIFRGSHDIRMASLFEGPATSFLLVLFFGAGMIWGVHLDLRSVVLLVLLAMGIGTVAAGLRVNSIYRLTGQSGLVSASYVWPIAWPILITNLTVFIANQADLWIIGIFSSIEAVALYGAALRTVILISMPLQIVNSVIQPMIVELYSKGETRRLEKMLGITAAISALPAVVILALIVFGGSHILVVVFGEAFAEGSMVLTILCIGRAVSVLAGSCGQCMMMGGLQGLLLKTTLVNGCFSIVTAILLVDDFGGVGVAVAFAAGTALQNMMQAFLVKKHMGVSTFARFDWIGISFR